MSAPSDLVERPVEAGAAPTAPASTGVEAIAHSETCDLLGKMLTHAANKRSTIAVLSRMNMRTGEATGHSVVYDPGRREPALVFRFCPFCGVSLR